MMKISRTLGPWGPALVAFDEDDKPIVMVLMTPTPRRGWHRGAVTPSDRKRVRKALQAIDAGEMT